MRDQQRKGPGDEPEPNRSRDARHTNDATGKDQRQEKQPTARLPGKGWFAIAKTDRKRITGQAGHSAFSVWCTLCHICNDRRTTTIQIPRGLIASEACVTKRTVDKCVHQLVGLGMLTKKQGRRRPGSKELEENKYTIHPSKHAELPGFTATPPRASVRGETCSVHKTFSYGKEGIMNTAGAGEGRAAPEGALTSQPAKGEGFDKWGDDE